MSEEKIKKKLNCHFFFLVGPVSSTSEDSSTVEYSECGLSNVRPEQKMIGDLVHMDCYNMIDKRDIRLSLPIFCRFPGTRDDARTWCTNVRDWSLS